MQAFHDSRDERYRAPYGALELGASVELALDVWECAGASTTLRTWVDGVGERLYPMERIALASDAAAHGGPATGEADCGFSDEGSVARFRIDYAPEQAGVVWYQFIIAEDNGHTLRYGAQDGCRGGVGRLAEWEPPSFQLTVYETSGANRQADCTVVSADEGCGGQTDHAAVAAGESDYERAGYNTTAADGSGVGEGREGAAGGSAAFPFTDAIASFMREESTAYELAETIEAFRENAPAKSFVHPHKYLSGRSSELLLAQLAGAAPLGDAQACADGGQSADASSNAPNTGATDENTSDEAARYGLDDGQRGLAKGRLWCASLIQMLMPADVVPFERAGIRSETDAYSAKAMAPGLKSATDEGAASNPADADATAETSCPALGTQSFFPDASADADCIAIAQNASDLCHILPLFATGSFSCFAVNEDVFGIWRTSTGDGADDVAACLLVNRSLHHAHDVHLPLAREAVSDIVSGYAVPIVESGNAGAGAVAGEGTHTGAGANTGANANASSPSEARALAKASTAAASALASSGALPAGAFARMHLYQVGSAVLYFHPRQRLAQPMEAGLGVLAHVTSIPTGGPHTKGTRQHAGTLGAPSKRFADWLADCGVRYWQVLPVNPTDEFGSPYAGISVFAGNPLLLEHTSHDPASQGAKAYRAFCKREADWLEPYACFMAIRDKVGEGIAWQSWPVEFRSYSPTLLDKHPDLQERAEAVRREQFDFDCQWNELRARANAQGVQIVGDMPIYVSADSADVWANPHIFQLGTDGRPHMVAGCPPDQFATDGQIWGNPVYDWDALAREGYAWWLRRLERAFELYDVVRLDHFIGFARYFRIPAGEKATAGAYLPGPGLDFFKAAYDAFGSLPIIAEDLGSITPAVRALVAACGFPGMDIVQFVDGNDPLSGYCPRPEKIAYTGTHDNQTLVGYCEARYPHLEACEAAATLTEAVAESAAPVRVLALQDVLALDDTARMNTPGTAEGNWAWQASQLAVEQATERLRSLGKMA